MTKDAVIRTRLSKDEATAFKAYADTIGQHRSRLIRQCVRELVNCCPDLLLEEQQLVKAAVRQLSGIARNLNQVCAAMHSGKMHRTIDADYLATIINEVAQLRDVFLRYLSFTRKRSMVESKASQHAS